MPVIINELEIISEPAPSEEGLPADAGLSPPKPNMLPQEVEAIVEQRCERAIRLRAD